MEVHLHEAFTLFHDQFGTGPGLGPSSGTCILTVPSLPHTFIGTLFATAAYLHRTDPWRRLRPCHLLGLRSSPAKHPSTCAQFTGADGGDLGFHLFRSPSDALKATSAIDTLRVPGMEILRLVFYPHHLLSAANKRMVRSLSLQPSGELFPVFEAVRCTSSDDLLFRNPTLEELKHIYLFMKAVSSVHPMLQVATGYSPGPRWIHEFEPLAEVRSIELPPELSEGGSERVTVTISQPSNVEKQSVGDSRITSTLRKCAVCSVAVPGEESLCCIRCRAVVYCGPVCHNRHWKDGHKNLCGVYKEIMEREEELEMKIFTFPCFVLDSCKWLESRGLHRNGMWRRMCDCYSHYSFGLLPCSAGTNSDSWGGLGYGEYPPDSPFINHSDGLVLLSGWSEYYSLRSLPMSSPVAAILSHSFTIWYIITALCVQSKHRLMTGKEVVLLCIGPEVELDWIPAFSEIGHLLNGIGSSLRIIMVGPEVPSDLTTTESMVGGSVKITFVRGLYQEKASDLSTPHVAAALNSGLEKYSSWRGALELIKYMNVPCFFTERTAMTCANAKRVLRECGLHVTHPVIPNPFRSPLREQALSSNLPSFSNGFVFGVNT